MKNTIQLLLFLIVFIGSCKKDETTTINNTTIVPTYLIKSVSYTAGEPQNPSSEKYDATYAYDSLNRVIQIVVNGQKSCELTYLKNMVLLHFFDSTGAMAESDTCLLNSAGNVMKTGGWTYGYNTDNYIQSALESGATEPEQYIWSNGNMIKVLHRNGTFDEYSYLNDKIDNRIGLVNMDYLPTFRFSNMGNKSKNLVHSISKNFSNANDNTTTNYTYLYDDKGRITKETRITTYATGPNPPLTEIFSYGYFN